MFHRMVSLYLRVLVMFAVVVAASSGRSMATTGGIAGMVCDADNGQPLQYANVVVVGTTMGANTLNGGKFYIPNVPVGSYVLQASYVGYDPITRKVSVRAGETAVVSFCGDAAEERQEDIAPPKVIEPIPDPGTGQMWSIGDGRAQLPLRKTNVEVAISGSMAHVTVEQTFENRFHESIEAVYVFPLPHKAAVHAMSMRIGARQLQAEIRKRQEATAIYEEARREGRTAALLQQERPNIFTQQVANIAPGNDVVVRIEYSEAVSLDSERYELVIPTVVGPRFVPGVLAPAVLLTSATQHTSGAPGKSHGSGWSPDTDQVPDASRITPPNLLPGQDGGHRLAIKVQLNAGLPLADITSVNHAVAVQHAGVGQAVVTTRPSDAIANKDFVLRYRTGGDRVDLGLLTHRHPDDAYGYFQLVLEPPTPTAGSVSLPRDILLILDVSGSMKGAPIETLKGIVSWLLRHLEERDSFNIVTFSNTAYAYAPGSLVANAENVRQALRFVEDLRGGGGTQMAQGIEAAFALRGDEAHHRTICMLTDGLVGNDRALLQMVQERIGNDRLFAMGIGSSPNRFLVDGLAEEGLGAQDFVALDEDPRTVVERFFARIDLPVLEGLQIDWGGLQVLDLQPMELPALLPGQVLRLTGRYAATGEGRVVLRGMRGEAPFERSLHAVLPRRAPQHAALRSQWARTRIHQLTRGERNGGEDVATEVEALGLQFAMMTDYTAFVVTDNQVVNENGVPRLVPQPVEMPQGVRHEMIFGSHGKGMRKGVGGRSYGVVVTGDPKRVDVKSSSVSHRAVGDVNLPPSSVRKDRVSVRAGRADEALVVPDIVVQGGELHVRCSPPSSMPLSIRDPLHRLQMKFELVETKVQRGDLIQLRIWLKNDTNQDVRLPQQYRLNDGTLLLQIGYKKEFLAMPLVETSEVKFADALQPGEERHYLVSLNDGDGFVFERRGRYEILILRLFGVWVPEDQNVVSVNVR